MSLVGTYQNNNTGETLTIASANDANGQLAGSLTSGGRTLNVTGHYHYNNGGPATSIAFFGVADNPNLYEAWACSGTAQGFTQLNAMGARTSIDASSNATTVGLGGLFIRK